MSILLSLLSGVLSGGATGLLGVLLQRFFDFKNKQLEIEVVKLNHANALALADKETERARLRADADVQVADRDAEARENEAAHRSLLASYEHDKASYLEKGAQKRKGWIGGLAVVLMATVDFARGILRPGLTIHLTVIVTIMFTTMVGILRENNQLQAADVKPLLTLIVNTITYCWTTCVIWWFGTRQSQSAK